MRVLWNSLAAACAVVVASGGVAWVVNQPGGGGGGYAVGQDIQVTATTQAGGTVEGSFEARETPASTAGSTIATASSVLPGSSESNGEGTPGNDARVSDIAHMTGGATNARWETTGGEPVWLVTGRLADQADGAYKQFREALYRRIAPDYNQLPLRQVKDDLSDRLGIPIVLDELAMSNGISSPDDPVTLTTGEIPLHTALELILEPLDLTYVWKDGCIVITTIDEGDQSLRYYDLSQVLPNPALKLSLINTIQTVIPGAWDNGDAISVIGPLMAVNCGEKTHWEIERLLARISVVPQSNLQQAEGSFPAAMGGGMGGMGGGMGGGGQSGGGFF